MVSRKAVTRVSTITACAEWRANRWLACLAWLFLGACLPTVVVGQERPNHYFHSVDMPPGAVGRGQLMRGGPLPGHFQPVEVSAPKGAEISLAVNGTFEPAGTSKAVVGMLVGNVYRIKVTNIPFHPGQEVFPSLEIIHRLFPPQGDPARFPIPIELTQEELRLALNGQYVVRVVYLEDPHTALPRRQDPEHQRYFDVGADQDPLKVADRLGRPMAILRIGSRIPEVDQVSGRFLFQSPPWIRLPAITTPSQAPPEQEPVDVATRPVALSNRATVDDQQTKRE